MAQLFRTELDQANFSDFRIFGFWAEGVRLFKLSLVSSGFDREVLRKETFEHPCC